jgi:hypothetical protein
VNSFEAWKIIYWVVGTVGIGGAIALACFFPAVAKLLLDGVVRFFALVFSYRIGCALVAGALAWFVADYVRHSIEDDKHAAEVEAFEKAQKARDARIKTETRALVWEEIANATAENAVTDKDVKDFTDALPKPPDTGNPFAIGSDACRLRAIYGQPGCGSVGAQGVPKADTKDEGVGDQRNHGLSNLVRRIRRHNQQGEQGNSPSGQVRRQGDQ